MEKKKKNSGRAQSVNKVLNAENSTVFHSEPPKKGYNIYDNEIAFDNLTNDIPIADMQDMI
ncbi:MAG: hypothetical protein J1E34_03840 [Oscillospiraceae bacterium]|nr:hypothetical protein [Oscillospiraceae bacterium]